MRTLVILASVLGLGLVSVESAMASDVYNGYSRNDRPYNGYKRHDHSYNGYSRGDQSYNGYSRNRHSYNGYSRNDYPYNGYSRRTVQKSQYQTRYTRTVTRSTNDRYQASRHAFPSRISSPGGRLFIFSPRMLAWAAYSPDGQLVRTGRASGGSGWCSDIGRSCRTPQGSFRIHSLGSAGCRSTIYPKPRGGAPMPYCMFFSKYYGVHGSYDVPNYNASHGCVRVTPSDAAWLRFNFMTVGTRVVVKPY